jgi:hypothetical protein
VSFSTNSERGISLVHRQLRTSSLGVKLVLLVLIKILVLSLLWHVLIKPYRVSVKADAMAQQFTRPVVAVQEKSND